MPQNPAVAPDRLPGLDGLRALSISLVIFYHISSLPHLRYYPWLERLASRGNFGVEVFFVISGFLITWLLLKEEAKNGRISLRQFYLRRAFRILPPAFAYLLFVAVLAVLGISEARWKDILAAAFFVRNVVGGATDTVHYWSLSIEEQFYLLWPFLLVMLPRRYRVSTVVGLLLVAPVWHQINIRLYAAAALNTWRADFRYSGLMMGCLLALWRSAPRTLQFLRHPVLQSQFSFVVFVAVTAFLVSGVIQHPGYVVFLFSSVEAAGVALALNYLVEGPPGLISWMFNRTPIIWLGQLSFSLYLWQQIFCGGSLTLRFPINVVAALVCAALSFYLVERPALRLRNLVTRRLAQRVPRLAAVPVEA